MKKHAKRYATVYPRFRIDRNRPATLVSQVTERLTGLIECGKIKPGDFLPGSRTLAARLHVDRDVVKRSYQVLEERGLLENWGHMGKRVPAPSTRKRSTNSQNGHK